MIELVSMSIGRHGSFNELVNSQEFLYSIVVWSLSRVLLFATPWTVAHQAPLSMGFPRQGYWSGLHFPSPEDLSNPVIKTQSSTLQANSLPLSHQGSPLCCISDTYSERQAICEIFFTSSPPQKMISNHSPLFIEKSGLSLLHVSSCPLCFLQL